jgi:hypothetical protein
MIAARHCSTVIQSATLATKPTTLGSMEKESPKKELVEPAFKSISDRRADDAVGEGSVDCVPLLLLSAGVDAADGCEEAIRDLENAAVSERDWAATGVGEYCAVDAKAVDEHVDDAAAVRDALKEMEFEGNNVNVQD